MATVEGTVRYSTGTTGYVPESEWNYYYRLLPTGKASFVSITLCMARTGRHEEHSISRVCG